MVKNVAKEMLGKLAVVLLNKPIRQLLQEVFVAHCNTCPGSITSGHSAVVIRECLACILQAQGELSSRLPNGWRAWSFKLAILVNSSTLFFCGFLRLTNCGDILESTVCGVRFDEDRGESISCGMSYRCIGAVDDFPDRRFQ